MRDLEDLFSTSKLVSPRNVVPRASEQTTISSHVIQCMGEHSTDRYRLSWKGGSLSYGNNKAPSSPATKTLLFSLKRMVIVPPTKLQANQRNRSNHNSCFLSLPAELRITIYECMLGITTATQFEISINADAYASADTGHLALRCSKRPESRLDLAIFRVSRQIYREALPALYTRCAFCPMADAQVITMFFGQMSDFARSNITRLHLRPRPQKMVRLLKSRASLSQVMYGPSWSPACEKILLLLVALEELFIHLHPMYGHDLGRGDEIDWIIRPLSRLRGVKKILAFVGSTNVDFKTPELVHRWNELVKRADCEAEEYMASRQRVMSHEEGWSNPYWIKKRNKLLDTST